MNKKKLINKIIELIEAMNSLQRQLDEVKQDSQEIRQKLAELESLQAEKEIAEPWYIPQSTDGFTVCEEALDEEPEREAKPVNIPVNSVPLENEIIEYGSVTIGKVVQESVKYANLISTSNAPNKKELLNLIMGKAEVAKSEIFNITESDMLNEVQRELLDAQYADAVDYFKSVAGQIA